MKPDMSEFSFGYAVTSEVMDRYALSSFGAPQFPSLQQEGKTGGYDVALPGIAVFLQFKLSEELTRRSALDYQMLGLPYYRFSIRAGKHSKQHTLLSALEATGAYVFYVAPCFRTMADLSSHYRQQTVMQNCCAARPSALVITDDLEHTVSFVRDSAIGVLRSEPVNVPVESFARSMESLARSLADGAVHGAASARDLGETVIQLYLQTVGPYVRPQSTEDIRKMRDNLAKLPDDEFLRFTSLLLLGCEVIWLRPPRLAQLG